MKDQKKYRFLFAGGGTGGHLFPAIAVAERIQFHNPDAELLFIGTRSKIEGKIIPSLGYKFKSIWIKGFSRSFKPENLLFPLKLLVSLIQSVWINFRFKPDVAIGSGGYVAGPAIWGASVIGSKIILLEQNSLPGITTRLLEKCANEIHISYEDSVKYFKDKSKLRLTGNPVRKSLELIDREYALKQFRLKNRKTLLVLGGSLGAATINEAVAANLNEIVNNNIQIIWQTGKLYYDKFKAYESDFVRVFPFIESMDAAYSSCNLLLARAGATTIAEITMLGLPAILVPSPNVAENHQYYNAKSLFEKNAAFFVEDEVLSEKMIEIVVALIADDQKLNDLSSNAKKISKPDAADIIAKQAIKLADAK
jgi:UDP-N-acetylglucosamine--N-acetylmuramyl-(pentapeptide) pyrophosphoryl-undecaprenol N-acetylglucosamine transferase